MSLDSKLVSMLIYLKHSVNTHDELKIQEEGGMYIITMSALRHMLLGSIMKTSHREEGE